MIYYSNTLDNIISYEVSPSYFLQTFGLGHQKGFERLLKGFVFYLASISLNARFEVSYGNNNVPMPVLKEKSPNTK